MEGSQNNKLSCPAHPGLFAQYYTEMSDSLSVSDLESVAESNDCQLSCGVSGCLGEIGEHISQGIRQRFGRQPLLANDHVIETACHNLINLRECLQPEVVEYDGPLATFDQTTNQEYSAAPVRYSRLMFGDGQMMRTPSVPPGVRYHYPPDGTWGLQYAVPKACEVERDEGCTNSLLGAESNIVRDPVRKCVEIFYDAEEEIVAPNAGNAQASCVLPDAMLKEPMLKESCLKPSVSRISEDKTLDTESESHQVKINEKCNHFRTFPRPTPEQASALYMRPADFDAILEEAYGHEGKDVYELGQAPPTFQLP